MAPSPHSGLVEHYLRVAPPDIAYLKFILESYESVGFMRTIDPAKATVVLYLVPDFVQDGEKMLDSLAAEIEFERIERPADCPEDWLFQSLS